MATVLQHKRSEASGSVPGTSDLALGEIAINSTDGYIFIKKNNGGSESIVTFRPGVSTTAATSSVSIDEFVGDGSTRVFTLPRVVTNEQEAFVFINGVLQHTNDYTISGNSITLDTAPDLNDEVEIRVIDAIATEVVLRDAQKFFYSITGTTTSISGIDDNGLSLVYDIGKVDVYQNGVRLIEGRDYTATTGTSVLFDTSLENGDIVEVVSMGAAALRDADAIRNNSAAFTTTSTNQVIETFAVSTYRTAKYIVQASSTTNYHSTEVLLIHDNTNVYMTEYGTIFSNISLMTLDADIVNGEVRLLCSPTQANTNIKLQRITVTV